MNYLFDRMRYCDDLDDMGDTGGVPLPTPIAEYRFTETSGTQLTDYSGNGNHGTIVGSPTLEGWGITTAANKYITGAAATSAAKTLVLGYAPPTANAGIPARWLSGNTGGPYFWRFPTGGGTSLTFPDVINPHDSDGTSLTAYSNAPKLPAVVAIRFSNPGAWFVEGRPIPMTNQILSNDMSSRSWSGGIGFGGFIPNPAACTDQTYCWAALYEEELTDAQVAAASAIARAAINARSITPLANSPQVKATNILAMAGNSLTENMTISSIAPTGTWDYRALSRGGVLAPVVDQFAVEGAAPLYRPNATKNVMIVWLGIRSDAYSAAMATVTAVKARYPGWKVLVMSSISSLGEDTNMATCNAAFANDIGDADAYIDLTADAACLANLCTAGAYLNTTYYEVDQTHPNATGNGLIYPVIRAAINALTF